MTDTLSAPPPAPSAPIEEHRFPCDSCGADFRFDPRADRLICDFCGNSADLRDRSPWQGGIKELDFARAIADQLPAQEIEITRVTGCTSCGAQIEFAGADHARRCPFCASPLVADTGEHRHIKPRGVLPFALTEEQARAAMTDWLGRLWFAPNGLQDYARKGRRMDGIYVPFWTFDAQTDSRYRGERGTVHIETRVVTINGKTTTQPVTRVRWRAVSGQVSRFFDDVLVLASRSLPKRFTDALQPWDLAALEPYQPQFLAGFRAEGYTVELQDGYDEARAIMHRTIERDVRFDIGGDQQRVHRIDTDIRDVTFKHILLPVWVAAYKYRGETFRFVVNGRTGRVQGERPWSAAKIALAVLAGAVLAALIGYGMAQQ